MRGLLVGLGLMCVPWNISAAEVAFGKPGIPFPWATSEKQGFGTAYERESKVWFTIARGILTEVYYPRVDTPQTRDSQLLVTDGKTFLHQEQYDTTHEVTREPGSAIYHVKNRDRAGRYTIEKTIWTDPASQTLLQKIRVERAVDGLRFYYLHKPAAAASIFGDSATARPFIAGEYRGKFSGWQGLWASVPWGRTSVGYVGKSDGFTDLATDFKMDWTFDDAPTGNVALTGELAIPQTKGVTEFTVAIFFARSREEVRERFETIGALDVEASRASFAAGWRKYLSGLDVGFATNATLLETSLLILKGGEDKTFPGAIVASPSHPWGEENRETETTNPDFNVGYHVVWPRDVYHIATALIAAGDRETSVAVFRRLKRAQYTDADGRWEYGVRARAKRGSFPQNFWVDGTTGWGGYQADETAMPMLLGYRLWKKGWLSPEEAWGLVKEAANFLVDMGPWTQGERWEEVYGVSPNSVAYVIAAMVTASEIATAVNEPKLAETYLTKADSWSLKPGDNVEAWTFTTTGKLGNGKYYERIDGAGCDTAHGGAAIWDAIWNPNQDGFMSIGSLHGLGEGRFKAESEVVDGGFLSLVRLGVRAAKNAFIRESMPEVDEALKTNTPHGPGWHRYRFDGYGEKTKGRIWPLLTGERLHYELQFVKESGLRDAGNAIAAAVAKYEGFASPEGIFAEQAWDEGEKIGRPTGSAAPLLWAHAEYVEILKSMKGNGPFEEFPTVRARYGH